MILYHYNPKQLSILRAVGKYKFLDYQQMSRLGIEKHKSNLSTLVKNLKEGRHPLLQKIPHRTGTTAKFYLTKKGMQVLTELDNLDEDEIDYPKGIIYAQTQDEKHRTTTIDIQIELDIACQEKGIESLLCVRYFDTTGNNRVDRNLASKTAIIYEGKKTLKADLVFVLDIQKQKELYLLELENGRDTKKAVEKCINHGKAILKGSANERYNFKKGYRTLWVFEHESILKATLDRLNKDVFFDRLKEYFLFKSLAQIEKENFFSEWRNLAGIKRKLYYAKQVS